MSEREIDDEEAYRAIGQFVFDFSQLEFTIRYILWSQLKADDTYFTAVTSSLDFAKLCAVTTSIVDQNLHIEQETKAALKALISDCHKLNAIRVMVVHGTWDIGLGGMSVMHTSREKLVAKQYMTRIEELDGHSKVARKVMSELIDWARSKK